MTWPAIKSTKVFPDIIDALKILLPQHFPELTTGPNNDFRIGRVFPPSLQDRLPFVRMADIGGNDDGLTDVPLFDVDVFHTTFAQARDLAKGIQALLLSTPHYIGDVTIDHANTAMRPHDVPWDDDRVHRFYASYQLGARR